jgi:hypothetical protein
MIERKAAWLCAGLVGLMLVLSTWRFLTLDGWTIPSVQSNAAAPALLLFVFPAASALVVAALYWNGHGAAGVGEAKIGPWRRWGTSLSIAYCVGLLLMESLLVVRSLGLDLPIDLAALARAGGLVLALVALLAINRMPKLPWIEQAFKVGGELGPVYGPRFLRLQSRVVVVFMIAVIAWSLSVPPPRTLHSVVYILVASALLVVWSVATRRHLSRKWKLEQQRGAG